MTCPEHPDSVDWEVTWTDPRIHSDISLGTEDIRIVDQYSEFAQDAVMDRIEFDIPGNPASAEVDIAEIQALIDPLIRTMSEDDFFIPRD